MSQDGLYYVAVLNAGEVVLGVPAGFVEFTGEINLACFKRLKSWGFVAEEFNPQGVKVCRSTAERDILAPVIRVSGQFDVTAHLIIGDHVRR